MPRTLERDPALEADLFDRLVSPEPMSGCWIWLGGTDADGYGITRIVQGENSVVTTAHRGMWQLRNGPFPFGKYACHSCDTPACVNPDHIWPGTQSENMHDCSRKGRHASPLTYDTTNRVQCRVTVAIAREAAADPTFPLADAIKLLRRAYKKRKPEEREAEIAAALAKRSA